MNPYAKIAIKIAVVIVVCLLLQVAYNMTAHRFFVRTIANRQAELATQNTIAQALIDLLRYKDLLRQIRTVQLQDMETIRNLIPEADEFVLTSYLSTIHIMLTDNNLDTDGVAILGVTAPGAGTNFKEAFSSDPSELQGRLDQIMSALQMFENNMDQMQNLLVSFRFYQELGTEGENYAAIAGGIETHSFRMTVRGTYKDIKRFTYEIFNMRPHTALVSFQMAPQGAGSGSMRQYAAHFTLLTFGDANDPPPLWVAHRDGRVVSVEDGADGVDETDEAI